MAATSAKRPQNEDRRKVASRRRPPPYDELLDEIDEVVYAVAVDAGDQSGGRVERVSRQAERFTGHPPDDFYRDPGLWWKLVHPGDREAVSRTTHRLVESRQPVTREYRLLHRRLGEYRWIEDRVLPWLDSSGGLLGYFGAARDVTERRRLQGMLTGVAAAVSALTGTGYLTKLVGQLARVLEMDHALVGELSSAGQAIATVALLSEGRIQQNIEYDLAGTPCEGVAGGRLCTFESGVTATFPGDALLRAQGIESYCGMPLLGVDGAPVGILAVMSRRPIREPSLVESVLRIFAGRAAAEIERERAVRALRESEERYRSLFEALPIPVVCWRHVDGDFVLTEFNTAGRHFTRGRGSELIGQRASELYTHDPSIIEDLARCWHKRRGFKREMDYTLRSTGERKALAVTYSFAPPDLVIVLLEDQTEQRQVFAALTRSERKYRTLFEEAPAGILLVDNDVKILEGNRQLCVLLGFLREELVGRHALALLDDEGRELARQMCTAARGGRRRVVELHLRRKKGTWLQAEVSARQVEPGRMLAIVRDIGDRKRAEAALRQLSARVLQLQDEERRRIARDLHDGTGQALAGLALKLSAFLRTARLDRAGRNTLRGAKKLAEQCARETRTLSYLLHPPLLEEAGLSSALAWLVHGFAERSGIRSRLEQPQGDARLPPEIELALFRVVQEGLANVHRHSGSPTAEVRMVKRQGEVSVEIRDKGHGIPRSQLSQAMTRGVGIAGMRERLHELGGQLEVRSSPRGTVVRAIVPIAVEHG